MTTAQQGAAVETRRLHQIALSRLDWVCAALGLACLAVTCAVFLWIPATLVHFKRISTDGFYKQALLRLDTLLLGISVSTFLLAPVLMASARRLRVVWRNTYTYVALAAICAFLWFFVVHFGRIQFGAWDYNIMIETGWRQILGQRPYVDFPATTPPGFNLGAKYAFELFGISWNANLYFTAIFTCATFLWMYWLMRANEMGRLSSSAIAFAVECAGVLTLCFWWYNDSALISAAVFFLSCLAYAKRPRHIAVQVSYVASLVLLSLMKPNIAGLAIVCSVVLLFVVTKDKFRLLILTACATVIAVAVLVVNHVSIPAMLASYLSVAGSRGGVGARFGYRQMSKFERHSALVWMGVLSAPMIGLIPKVIRQIVSRDWRGIALVLLFPVSLLVGIYGLATNGEFRDLECTLLIAACGVLTFGLRWNGLWLRRYYIAVLCASMAADLYYGATRIRVYGIGAELFFDWQDNKQRIPSGFLKDVRVSGAMLEVEKEVGQAIQANPGPFFLGPRLEFNYAAFHVPSPAHYPAYWQPATAFGAADAPEIFRSWRQHRFQTLIFMKSGFGGYGGNFFYLFYPQDFLDAIHSDYIADQSYPDIIVYHLKNASK